MSNLDLEKLAQNREALLLAEAAGWLHDYRKCSDEHLCVQAANLTGQQALPRSELSNRCPQLTSTNIRLLNASRTVADLLNNRTWNNDILGRYLCRCHRTSHFDKQEPVDGGQNHPGTRISTPFGFEKEIPGALTRRLWTSLCNYSAGDRNNLFQTVGSLFSQTLADTRRPINEVDLWSWAVLGGALYKAALAGALLIGNIPCDRDLHWRLLSIRVRGLDYLFTVERIPDMLARQELLASGFEKVRYLLEITYPLGSEVYGDVNGSLFVVPDVPDLLGKTDSNGVSLQELILREFAQATVANKSALQVGGEMRPYLELESPPWWGQDPRWPQSSNDKLPDVGTLLARKVVQQAEPDEIREYWRRQTPTDICTVCGLRPQGPGQKAADRNVCDICEKRRADRSKEWATRKLHTTIWTNEVADKNGRLALVVGSFDLTHWLSGDLVRTLVVREPNDENGHKADRVSKNPSFARLRRIWETTRRFWREVCPPDEEDGSPVASVVDEAVGRKGSRLEIKGKLDPRQESASLGHYHAYELVLPRGVRLSVVWDRDNSRFITADNLEYLSGKTQLDETVRNFLKAGNCLTIEEPAGYGSRNKIWGSIRLNEDAKDIQASTYTPAIPILSEPRIFIALVPADKALEIARGIKTKYEREMGKVRNRLPLHLGAVFAHRRTPLRALLDAGRSMLSIKARPDGWKVICCARKSKDKVDGLPARLQADKDGQFKEWFEVTLEREGRQICWHVPAVMGDGSAEDLWYPYVFLSTDTEPTDRPRRYRTRNPWTEQDGWLVHAGELEVDDTVYFTPSTFDYEFLDVTSRRFEIHYEGKGRRTTRRPRPYYLEDLERLENIWNIMKRLKKAQRYQAISAIEATREAWFGEDRQNRSLEDSIFRGFVADTLAGAAWPKSKKWKNIPEKEQKLLIEAGVRGELADLAEIHMEILKED